jgi:hypothetical protein
MAFSPCAALDLRGAMEHPTPFWRRIEAKSGENRKAEMPLLSINQAAL